MKIARSLALLLLAISAPVVAQDYKVSGSIAIGGTGHWDYLTVDSENRRLYVSHNSEVVVIDVDSQKVVGKVPVDGYAHGIAIAASLKYGFITDGESKTSARKSPEQMLTFGLEDLAIKGRTKVGEDPDAVAYDSFSKKAFVFNGDPMQLKVVDPNTHKVDKVLDLGGNPEFSVSDGRGNVYVNIKDKSEIVQIDSKSLVIKARWPLSPCEEPTGLALDRENRRLFPVCGNGTMVVVDADSGKVVATVPIGAGPDAAAYDPGTKLAFSANRDGTLTVIRQISKDEYSVLQNLKTELGARTMALDPKTHTIYLSSGQFGPPPAGSKFPSVVPETFKVLILRQQ